MRKMVVVLGLLLAACSCSVPTSLPPERPRTAALLESVVALLGAEGNAYCSGVHVPAGILTAEHCVHDNASVLVGFYRSYDPDTNRWGTTATVQVLAVDEHNDLALLSVDPSWSTPGATVAVEQPDLGSVVRVVGHPMGFGYTVHKGTVSSLVHAREDTGGHYFFVDAGLIGGNSGGPVFDVYGQVVGIVSFRMGNMFSAEAHLGGVVDTVTVRRFLDAATENRV